MCLVLRGRYVKVMDVLCMCCMGGDRMGGELPRGVCVWPLLLAIYSKVGMYVSRIGGLIAWVSQSLGQVTCFAVLRLLLSVSGLGLGEGAVGNDGWYRKKGNNVIIRLPLGKGMLG